MSDLPNNREPEPTGAGPAPPVWRTYPEAIALILRGGTARTGVKVALVVGTLLSAVNQGATILGGHATEATWGRVAVNYLVPYLVASAGYLAAFRVRVRR